MREKARKTIAQFHMFPQGAKLIVGLSGGADSVALLHLLSSMKEEFAWEITAVHIHHGLRGKEADGDARFAEQFCASLDIPCIVQEYDVKAEAKARGLGEEETGRILRYAAFREVAGKTGYIAVAHHQKDQAETVLMRLCRGTGLTGLVGMAPVRENICRPLLFCTRGEIERYCKENDLTWREDATNSQEKYTRNKLRLRVLPVLEEINPKAVEHIAETAALLAEEEDFLEQQTNAFFEEVKISVTAEEVCLSRERLKGLHPAMRRRVLRKAMGCFLQMDVSQVQIEALEDLLAKETGKSRDFLEGIHGENRYDALVLSRKKEQPAEGFCYELIPEREVLIPEAGIAIGVYFDEKNAEISDETCTNVFDYDKIKHTLFCRTRKAGDVIPLQKGRKKIKDLFIDEKIPRDQRAQYPLITAGEEVLWAPGLRVSAAAGADGQTIRKVWIRIRRVQK